jgi:hypothetical protein
LKNVKPLQWITLKQYPLHQEDCSRNRNFIKYI